MKDAPRPSPAVDLRVDAHLDEATWDSWLRGVKEAAQVARRPRFSLVKTRQYIAYAHNTSVLRHVVVVCVSSLAGLAASVLLPLLPLQDPSLGVSGNPGFYVHLTITIGITAVSTVIAVRAMTGITRDEYPQWAVASVSVLTTALLVAMFALLGTYWRFPVPFAPVLVFVPWILCITLAHIVTLRGRLASRRLRNHLLFYLPSVSVQVSQLVIYPAYSALFNASGAWVQAALIAFFPVLKFLLKKNIAIAHHHVSDYAREEAASAVEISASMYQSMIVQGTPSPLMTGLVIALDVVLGIVDVKRLMGWHTVLPDVELVHAGIAILERGVSLELTDDQLQPFATKTVGYFELTFQKMGRLARSHSLGPQRSVAPLAATPVVVAVPPTATQCEHNKKTNHDELVLTQSLEMLQSIETILLVEYLEVIVPIVNTIYVVAASQLPSAIYNTKLRPFMDHGDALTTAVSNMILYALLQGATLVAVCVVIHVRYALSPLAQIAFALEKHVWSLQGKLVAWLPTILAFSIAHYGTAQPQ